MDEIKEIGESGYEHLKATLKFGDIIENGWASSGNPRRIGIIVKSRDFSIQCTDKKEFWDLLFDSSSKIKVHGSVLNDNYEKLKDRS